MILMDRKRLRHMTAMSQYCDQRRPNQPEGPFTDMLLNLMENVYSEESSFCNTKDQGFRTD